MWLSGHYPTVIQRLSTAALAKSHSSVFSRSWHANHKMINGTNETFFFWHFVTGFANHVTRDLMILISVPLGTFLASLLFSGLFLSPTMLQVLDLSQWKVEKVLTILTVTKNGVRWGSKYLPSNEEVVHQGEDTSS